jgi:AraC family transcriptional regulator
LSKRDQVPRAGARDHANVTTVLETDRLRSLIDVIVESLDDHVRGEDLAGRAYLSRFHFDRLVRAALGETVAAFRRRLLLERAAYELARGAAVLDVALASGYRSGEAFARAFGRAFSTQPSRFRGEFRLPAPNGVHFHPPGGLLVPGDDRRRQAMDLTERLVEHDNWLTRHLIDRAAALDDARLDEPVPLQPPTNAFAEAAPSLRGMLDRLVFTKEISTAAITGRAFTPSEERSLDGLRERLDKAGAEFSGLVRDIRDHGTWDTAFVDALCEPPESFTFGGAVAHVVKGNGRRASIAADVLRGHGIEVTTDPIAWERLAEIS